MPSVNERLTGNESIRTFVAESDPRFHREMEIAECVPRSKRIEWLEPPRFRIGNGRLTVRCRPLSVPSNSRISFVPTA